MTFPIPAEAPTEVTIVDLADGPTATIRFDGVTMADLRNCYDSSSGALQAAIQAGAFTPAGPFLGIYHGDPHGTFDLEVGFPVEVSLEQERTFDGLTVRPGTKPTPRRTLRTHCVVSTSLRRSSDSSPLRRAHHAARSTMSRYRSGVASTRASSSSRDAG